MKKKTFLDIQNIEKRKNKIQIFPQGNRPRGDLRSWRKLVPPWERNEKNEKNNFRSGQSSTREFVHPLSSVRKTTSLKIPQERLQKSDCGGCSGGGGTVASCGHLAQASCG
jgi:hypothetical protein